MYLNLRPARPALAGMYLGSMDSDRALLQSLQNQLALAKTQAAIVLEKTISNVGYTWTYREVESMVKDGSVAARKASYFGGFGKTPLRKPRKDQSRPTDDQIKKVMGAIHTARSNVAELEKQILSVRDRLAKGAEAEVIKQAEAGGELRLPPMPAPQATTLPAPRPAPATAPQPSRVQVAPAPVLLRTPAPQYVPVTSPDRLPPAAPPTKKGLTGKQKAAIGAGILGAGVLAFMM